MTPKSSIHVIQGMQKDTSKSKVGKEFAFHNHNIRITAREDNTLLSITNTSFGGAIATSLYSLVGSSTFNFCSNIDVVDIEVSVLIFV